MNVVIFLCLARTPNGTPGPCDFLTAVPERGYIMKRDRSRRSSLCIGLDSFEVKCPSTHTSVTVFVFILQGLLCVCLVVHLCRCRISLPFEYEAAKQLVYNLYILPRASILWLVVSTLLRLQTCVNCTQDVIWYSVYNKQMVSILLEEWMTSGVTLAKVLHEHYLNVQYLWNYVQDFELFAPVDLPAPVYQFAFIPAFFKPPKFSACMCMFCLQLSVF